MTNIFDALTVAPHNFSDALDDNTAEENKITATCDLGHEGEGYTPSAIKSALQTLLKYGLLEAQQKPNLYKTAITQQTAINQILEPLDLRLKIDDIRGLAFVVDAESFTQEDNDAWSHPLIRRQRLTAEQSLLLAILRQHYAAHEQEAGVGAGNATVLLEDLLPQLTLYLGESGRETKDQNHLRNLLESLKVHGIISEIDDNDQITIRPIITHLVNSETLQSLLQHFKQLAKKEVKRG
jgi:hypothetical protein